MDPAKIKTIETCPRFLNFTKGFGRKKSFDQKSQNRNYQSRSLFKNNKFT